MDQKIPYDDYQLPVVFLPSYESPPAWIAPQERIQHPDYNNELTQFLPRTVVLKKPPGAQLGFNIRGGKASQLGIFISKVVPDSDAHRAGLQEGDQVLSVNEVDFQDIEHSRAVEILKTAREILMRVRFFPYTSVRPLTIQKSLAWVLPCSPWPWPLNGEYVQLLSPFFSTSTMALSSTFSRESALWRDSSAGSIMGRTFCSGNNQGF
ncbi:PDZ domain-containing protein 11 [Merluccius polli]|uniref:PDZ domain-containing protein 11 n=1 Tax=Merluccius polli TaxID=89951 RepID=A0AA47M3F2_MERPO|nr:PDZ domain-containing protein 11 [Merluccius polli]